MKKKNIVITALIVFIAVTTFTIYKLTSYRTGPLEPAYKLVNTLYFNNGTYEDYKTLFTSSKNSFTEKQFNAFRKSPTIKDFKYGSSSVKEIMSHMKTVQNGDKATIYYLKDVNDKNEMKTAMKWNVEKSNGKWVLKNN